MIRNGSNSLNFVLYTERIDKPELIIYDLNYEQLKDKKVNLTSKDLRKSIANLDDILIMRQGKQLLLDNLSLTAKNQLTILFYECELFVIDNQKGQILTKQNISNHQITIDYFLSPTNITSNNLHSLVPIENTNILIGLDNLNHLNIINYNFETNKIIKNLITDTNGEPVQIDSFRINLNLIVLNLKNSLNKIVILKIDNLLKKFQLDLKNTIYEINISKDSSVELYGLNTTNKYAFLIENQKTLRFFNIETRRELIDTVLYSRPGDIVCNNDFICLSMQDSRIISYLINDPEDPNAYNRIKNLNSR